MTTPSWTAGYVSDIAYTLGFYREMAPPMLDYALALGGIAGPAGAIRYCELGCGRGYGTTLMAAANPDSSFVGIDFNPEHIREARELAARAAIDNVQFIEASFAEVDPGLGDFDVIALHGVYSWVSPAVRADIVAFLRTRLAPGGVVYVSYNTHPGWAPTAPAQHILKALADRAPGNSMEKLHKARGTLKSLLDSPNGYFAQNPAAKARITAMEAQDPTYLAHELLNGSWYPLYVDEVMDALAEAKLTYAGSAAAAENSLVLGVPADHARLVQSAPDPQLRELLKDYAINRQFRRDLYVRGAQRLQGKQAQARIDAQTFALLVDTEAQAAPWPVPVGSATFKVEGVAAILDRLRQGPATHKELEAAGATANIPAGDIATMLMVMVHNNVIAPCRPDRGQSAEAARRLNEVVLELARGNDSHRFLASPVLGSAIGTGYPDRVISAILVERPELSDADTVTALAELLDKAGKSLMRDGKKLELDSDVVAELTGTVSRVRQNHARWRALGILA